MLMEGMFATIYCLSMPYSGYDTSSRVNGIAIGVTFDQMTIVLLNQDPVIKQDLIIAGEKALVCQHSGNTQF